ncbi:2-acylglycerol O-acyltransferase 2-like [Actinia tenebrosa]|uniref:Acyltransferase n=1 Tax=Actinia tenebrosa TaxID=6105 RepID=A0A6P8IEN1_ACTTE|nr:2-acylglycerol O-acyltransferase 2-like [Actinia tenebrosa]
MSMPRPLRYILEVLCVACFYLVALTGGCHIQGLAFVLLLFTRAWPIVVIYVGWYMFFERNTPKQGGRPRKDFMIKLPLFKLMKDYYPITLEKTSELDPQKNYILGYHPHGLISEGAVVAIQSDALRFRDKFPGIEPHMTVHSFLLKAFLYRDILMSLGFVDVSKDSLKYALTKLGPGHSVILVVGGAAEIADCHPDVYRLTLKNRKGFIRVALETGSSLVPVLGFGQNNIYSHVWKGPGTLYWHLQHWLNETTAQYWFRFSFYCCYGFLGVLPWHTPINVVVGSPIEVSKQASPTEEEVNRLHARYLEEVKTLFNSFRDKYGVPKTTQLTFV